MADSDTAELSTLSWSRPFFLLCLKLCLHLRFRGAFPHSRLPRTDRIGVSFCKSERGPLVNRDLGVYNSPEWARSNRAQSESLLIWTCRRGVLILNT